MRTNPMLSHLCSYVLPATLALASVSSLAQALEYKAGSLTITDPWVRAPQGRAQVGLVVTPPPAGVNTVLVGQIFNVQRTLGLTPTEGEAIVFKPDGKGGYQLVGQLTATQWGDLVRDLVILKLDPQQLSDK